jgi:hypothetical protein
MPHVSALLTDHYQACKYTSKTHGPKYIAFNNIEMPRYNKMKPIKIILYLVRIFSLEFGLILEMSAIL